MKPRVAISIVIPAYNEERLIGRCLTSLKNQQFARPYEIIVVNNNSTDATEKIARSFGVKVIHELQQGVVFARQKGLLTARGEIVISGDSDCLYPPDWLQKIYAIFKQNSSLVAVSGPAIVDTYPWWAYAHYTCGFALTHLVFKITGYVLYVVGSNFAYKRQVFLDIGGYNTYLDCGGDEFDPLYRLQKIGKAVYNKNVQIIGNNRRYEVGFVKWLFIHLFYYYWVGFIVNKMTKRLLIQIDPVRT